MSEDARQPERPPVPRSPNGYARGDDTRARIIQAAVEVFGEVGFQEGSTRQIAIQAGVSPPALQYYFGGKLGLYQACVEHVTERIFERQQPAMAHAAQVMQAGAPRAVLIDAFCRLQDSLIDTFVAPDEGGSMGRLLSWKSASTGVRAMRATMRDRVEVEFLRVMSALMARIIGLPPDAPETAMRVFAVTGQVMVFQLDQARIRSVVDWEDAAPEMLALLKRVIRQQTTLLLEALPRQPRAARRH